MKMFAAKSTSRTKTSQMKGRRGLDYSLDQKSENEKQTEEESIMVKRSAVFSCGPRTLYRTVQGNRFEASVDMT